MNSVIQKIIVGLVFILAFLEYRKIKNKGLSIDIKYVKRRVATITTNLSKELETHASIVNDLQRVKKDYEDEKTKDTNNEETSVDSLLDRANRKR